jgi:hypothetical protein
VLDEPERKREQVIANPIHLSPRQTEALLRLLERNEGSLEKMRESEEEERSRALWKAYRILLDAAKKSKEKPNTAIS